MSHTVKFSDVKPGEVFRYGGKLWTREVPGPQTYNVYSIGDDGEAITVPDLAEVELVPPEEYDEEDDYDD